MIPQSVTDVLEGRSRYALLCCDGFALAAEMADGAADIVLGDLPYDERTHERARSLKDGGSDIDIDFAPLPPVETFAPALLRCSARWVLCFCAVEQLGTYQTAVGPEQWIRAGIWVRTNGTPQISSDRPAQGAEGIAIMHRTDAKKRWNGGGNRGVWVGPRCSDPTRKHPTKKPLWLMEALLRDFGSPGGVVLDPTAGESTTGEACLRLGLRYIGCEIDPVKHQWGVEPLLVFVRDGEKHVSNKIALVERAVHKPSSWGTVRTRDGSMRGKTSTDPEALTRRHRGSVWWYGTIGHGHDPSADTGHPATFAEAFAHDAVTVWSNPGDLVVDPFAGSATVGRACEDLGRHWIGAERVPKYHAIGMGRLAQRALPGLE